MAEEIEWEKACEAERNFQKAVFHGKWISPSPIGRGSQVHGKMDFFLIFFSSQEK